MALREALALGCNYIGTEHLLLGLVREGEGVAARILDESAINFEQLRTELTEPLTMQESVSALNRAIKRTRADKEDAIRRQNFDEAIVCRAKERELKALKRELKE
jgi:ATP-dependent Clp protease ATP-binding subunit ClpC